MAHACNGAEGSTGQRASMSADRVLGRKTVPPDSRITYGNAVVGYRSQASMSARIVSEMSSLNQRIPPAPPLFRALALP